MRAPLVGTIMSSSFLLVSLDEKRKINFKSITMWCAVHLMRKIHGKNPHEWERHRSGKYGSSQNHIYQSSLHDSNFYEISISPLYQIIFYQNDISIEHVWTSAINFSFIDSLQTWQKKTDKQSINLEIIKSWQYNACNLFYSNFNVVINNFFQKKLWSMAFLESGRGKILNKEIFVFCYRFSGWACCWAVNVVFQIE